MSVFKCLGDRGGVADVGVAERPERRARRAEVDAGEDGAVLLAAEDDGLEARRLHQAARQQADGAGAAGTKPLARGQDDGDGDARSGDIGGCLLQRRRSLAPSSACGRWPLAGDAMTSAYIEAERSWRLAMSIALAVVIVVVLLILARSVRIASEWQRAVILRLGRFHKVKGPGIYLVFPVIDAVAQVIDLRIQTTMITAEQALTRDTVAVGVDAIVFWQVENAETAAIRIANYREAIERVAQTSLREMIGATDLSKLLSDRKTADEQLRVTITAKTSTWGVTARSVEIKDVSIPRELQDAMSRQAQAEREKDARVTLASAEKAIAEQILEAAQLYGSDPNALKLRQMNLLYEMNKERGTTVLIPTDMANSLGTVVALARAIPPDPA